MRYIWNELYEKVGELKENGISDVEIKKEGLIFLKNALRSASYPERKQFFLLSERDRKLEQLLSDD